MAATWKVTGQRPTSQMQPGGDFVSGQNVTFATDSGQVGTVFIPLTQIGNQALVREAIQARADALEGIVNLTSQPPSD